MNQDPTRLLQDGEMDAELQMELARFSEHCAEQPFDLAAGLARFKSAAATVPPATLPLGETAAASTQATSFFAGIKGIALIGSGALAIGAVAVGRLWPDKAPLGVDDEASVRAVVEHVNDNTPAIQIPDVPNPLPPSQSTIANQEHQSTLQDELKTVREARRALAQGRAKQAVRILKTAQKRLADGALAPERKALLAIALFKSGALNEARQHAQRFLSKHPHSPMASRIRRLLNSKQR